jgi:hypothetical protein
MKNLGAAVAIWRRRHDWTRDTGCHRLPRSIARWSAMRGLPMARSALAKPASLRERFQN